MMDDHPYRPLSGQQDAERTNVHYMLPARFFEVLTGGRWHVYSCNLWSPQEARAPDQDATQTSSQERKLDLLAELLELSPGQRLVDVGAGWGGPLLYLCSRYGVRGVGLSLSPVQVEYATDWARRLGVDCQFSVCHWEDFRPTEPIDAVMTDEVIVHFSRLEQFLGRAFSWLGDGGIMVNKELHLGHPGFGYEPTKAIRFINEIYGESGFYRSLGDELCMTNAAGFAIEDVRQLDGAHYVATATAWRTNLRRHRAELVSLVGEELYRNYLIYLTLVVSMFSTDGESGAFRRMKTHVVKARKLPQTLRETWGIEAHRAATSRGPA